MDSCVGRESGLIIPLQSRALRSHSKEAKDLGIFNQTIRLDSMDGQRSLEIEAMVDTGASYTIVPVQSAEGSWECRPLTRSVSSRQTEGK